MVDERELELRDKGLFRRLSNTIESLKSKYILYVVKEVMLQEMEKPYYENAVNVKEFIDINPHFVVGEGGTGGYHHIENLCIWNNGFYNFNRFNLTTPAIRYGNQKKISVRKK